MVAAVEVLCFIFQLFPLPFAPSGVGHLTSCQMPRAQTLAGLRPADSEFPSWHGLPFCICTRVLDPGRGGTRSGIRFCFYLNHRQGKSGLFCLVRGPIHRLFFPSEAAKLGDISRLHSPDAFHLHMIHSCSEIDQCST